MPALLSLNLCRVVALVSFSWRKQVKERKSKADWWKLLISHFVLLAKELHAGCAPEFKALLTAALLPGQSYAWYDSAGSFLIPGNETTSIY